MIWPWPWQWLLSHSLTLHPSHTRSRECATLCCPTDTLADEANDAGKRQLSHRLLRAAYLRQDWSSGTTTWMCCALSPSPSRSRNTGNSGRGGSLSSSSSPPPSVATESESVCVYYYLLQLSLIKSLVGFGATFTVDCNGNKVEFVTTYLRQHFYSVSYS